MIQIVVEALLGTASALLLLPGVVLLVEAAAALLPTRRRPPDATAEPPRAVVLVPAHDEAGQIGATVRLLREQSGPRQSIVVIADNCSDETAALAAEAGARVIERDDPAHVGKGFAISFGLRHLDADPPDVVILVDADCRVSAGGLPILARAAATSGRPVQAEYLLAAPRTPGPLAVVGALAILLRNQVRPRGLRRLGLPCHLTGSGMAFPWRVLREAPETGANLVEDLVMGIELALQGHPPLSCPEVQISSELPETQAAGLRQRRRWEHGQLDTLRKYVPRLLRAGVARGDRALLALGLDLMVPPLALLVMLQVTLLAACGAAVALFAAPSLVPVSLSMAGLGAVSIAVGAAWVGFGRRTLPLRYALLIPAYMLWKIPLYLGLALRGKQQKWERTARGSESGADGSELPPS